MFESPGAADFREMPPGEHREFLANSPAFQGLALSSDPRDPCQIKGSSLEPGHQKAKADLWIKLVKLAWSCELISS